MSNAKHVAHAVLGAVSILAIGVVLGVLLDRVILHRVDPAVHSPTGAMALAASHGDFLRELQTDLGLTEEQAGRVQGVLTRHQAAVNDAWTAVHSRLDAAIDSVTAEIEVLLDPEQRAGLHAWLMERHGVTKTHTVGEGH